MNNRQLLILSALLLAGCVSRPGSAGSELIEVIQVEPLVAATVADDSVTIRVMSRGCTTKQSFIGYAEPVDGRQAVTFARRELDFCKAAPSPVDLRWTFEELDLPKGASVAVVNPIAAAP